MLDAMEALRHIARRQRGLFTRDQAKSCGLSAFQVRRRLASGDWRVVLEPVLAGADTGVTLPVRDQAAALAIPGSVLAGASAARRLGIPVEDATTYLWVGRLRGRRLPGVSLVYRSTEDDRGLPAFP